MRMTDPEFLPRQSTLGYHRSPASFSYKCRELLQKWNLEPETPRFRASTKLGAYWLLDRIGVAHARVHAVLPGLDRLRPEHLERPVVFKPLAGTSASGVMHLIPDPKKPGKYRETLMRRNVTFEEIVELSAAAREKRQMRDVWLLEEPLTRSGAVSDDFKFYTFQGDIALILQRRSKPGRSGLLARYKWYDADWNQVETGKHTAKTDPAFEVPDAPTRKALEETARRVSVSTPFAFTRVDTFWTDEGPRVGEINAWVGAYDHFDDEWDERLGSAWEAAELRIPKRTRTVPAGVPEGGYRQPRRLRRPVG